MESGAVKLEMDEESVAVGHGMDEGTRIRGRRPRDGRPGRPRGEELTPQKPPSVMIRMVVS